MTTALEPPETEDDKILGWRIAQLEENGMDHDSAVRYAGRTDVDLNEFRTLLQNGCPPELVARVSSLETV